MSPDTPSTASPRRRRLLPPPAVLFAAVCLAVLSCPGCDDEDDGQGAQQGLPTSGAEPDFDPAQWDELVFPEGWTEWSADQRRQWLRTTDEGRRFYDSFRLRIHNNCYNYACNHKNEPDPTNPGRPLGPPAEPGRGGGYTPPHGWIARGEGCTEVPVDPSDPGRGLATEDITCAVVTAASLADGLRAIDCDDPCPAGAYKKALAVDPLTHDEKVDGECDIEQTDYHWLRQDSNGHWSSKPGEALPTDDAPGDPSGAGRGDDILDPRDAKARANYTEFCGCFCCGPSVTKAGLAPGTGRSPLLVALLGVTQPAAPSERVEGDVQLVRLVYSGRRNPRIAVTEPAEQAEIAKRLEGLPEIARPDWPILGERGFALYTEDVELIARYGFALVVVYDGAIEIGTTYYRDVHDLEAWSRARWAAGASPTP